MDRISPWHAAADDIKAVTPVPPYTEALIANLTPSLRHIRLGVLVNGKETSITVPFDLATQFLDQIQALITKGLR